ncbi:mitochondrial GTPase 1-like [Daktulosphaira vitifoliae]|uniref:mitochondrial GTPase 1-like n=1 Tax=Daktulosphaira vitifoliae TaxID=58002 RepID=UPI0021A99478|nr:mitochondrial GTPase 1-like [Daktulosphaira vitifoliae]
MASQFRQSFKVVDKALLRWFPGHMGKGMKQMQQKLKSVDCIIEVHDARIPLSGRNPDFKYTISGVRPHILVLNKMDLIEMKYQKAIEKKILKEQNVSKVIFTNCKESLCPGIKQLVPTAQNLIKNSNRYNRSENKDFCIMIIGVPNVGKSSLINSIRNAYLGKKSAAHVGAVAGITRSVQCQIKVSHNPLIYVYDTPGIMSPSIKNVETGLKLALCATLKDHLVGEEIIADYLLYWLNKNNHFDYVSYLNCDEATDDIRIALAKAAIHRQSSIKYRNFDGSYIYRPDILGMARNFINAFRTGVFGKLMLDEDLLDAYKPYDSNYGVSINVSHIRHMARFTGRGINRFNPWTNLHKMQEQKKSETKTDSQLMQSSKHLVNIPNPYEKEQRVCILCKMNIVPDYKNTRMLSQFISRFTGRIYGRHITGLCRHKQDHVEKEIKKAREAGLLPHYFRNPEFSHDPKLFDPDNPFRPHNY